MTNYNKYIQEFALFEVIITIFILTFRILDLPAIEFKIYSSTRDSYYRINISLHTKGLAETMNANPHRITIAVEH